MLKIVEADLRDAYKITDKQERYAAVDAVKAKVKAAFAPQGDESAEVDGRAGRHRVQGTPGQDRPLEHPRHRLAHRRPRPEDGPPDRLGSRRPAAHPRLGAVHPRRDAGAGRRHARHRRGRAVCRRADRHVQGELPAPLQLPALFGRRDRPHGFAGPPRDRPRQARLARHPSDAAGRRAVPLHAARRLRDHRVQRLVLDGDGLRHLAGADGCRRSAGQAGCRHRHGPDQGRRALRRALRHPRRRGSSRRHGLQGRRHGRPASPRCRWTSRSRASPRRS